MLVVRVIYIALSSSSSTSMPGCASDGVIQHLNYLQHSFVNSRNLIGQSEGTKSLSARNNIFQLPWTS